MIENNVIHKRNVKQALNHGLLLKTLHRVIRFNQEIWLKPHFHMNTELEKNTKNDFEKDFFKFLNNTVFGKIMENVRKIRDITLETTKARGNYLESEPNYHTIFFFFFFFQKIY